MTRTRSEETYAVSGLSHRYPAGDVLALQGIDMVLPKGSVTALIGPSGCGKSTLLNILSGLLRPTDGGVTLFGSPLTGPPDEVAHMFQKATLLPWRTTLENVVLPIEIRDGKKAAKAAYGKARDLLRMVGIGDFEAAYPQALSGGMAQRAAICRMLITEPEVFLLDEPFGALDELTRERMDIELLRIAKDSEATVVLVTHSIPESVFLSDRVYAMSARPGRIEEVIDIDLPAPRTLDTFSDPHFVDRVGQVRRALNRGHGYDGQ
ncbi:ABC transporter ATP-binding protein [Ornithinimicrobium cavernae]|uniref:ABC transporter ATP-binding protein n=1 Tax=Ornithinimicrobium cavernae TaxID=2666047 RepID=UPI000D687DD0|nr:ABC transporter ATP-binding protein [Ornithinimicrobium cavernae]